MCPGETFRWFEVYENEQTVDFCGIFARLPFNFVFQQALVYTKNQGQSYFFISLPEIHESEHLSQV